MLLVVDNGSIYTEHLIDFLSKQKVEYETLTVGETPVRDWAEASTEKHLHRFDSFILTLSLIHI